MKNCNYHLLCHSECSIQYIPCHSERSDSGAKNPLFIKKRNEILRLRLRMTYRGIKTLRIKKGEIPQDMESLGITKAERMTKGITNEKKEKGVRES